MRLLACSLGLLAGLFVGAGCDDFSIFHLAAGDAAMGDAATMVDAAKGADAAKVADLAIAPDLAPPPPQWTAENSGLQTDLFAVWGSGSQDVWAVGAQGAVMHRDQNGLWSQLSSKVQSNFYAVSGTGPTDVWIGGDGGQLLHFTGPVGGNSFTPQTTFEQRTIYAATSLYLGATGGYVYSLNGQGQWMASFQHPTMLDLLGAWSGGTSTSMLVGQKGVAVNVTQILSREQADPSHDLHGVWSAGMGVVIAVGDGGVITRRLAMNGGNWFGAMNGDRRDLKAVWGANTADLWAAGQGGVLLHSTDDGASWSVQPSGTGMTIYGIWGNGPRDVYLVGQAGLILHRSN